MRAGSGKGGWVGRRAVSRSFTVLRRLVFPWMGRMKGRQGLAGSLEVGWEAKEPLLELVLLDCL